jgi:hypothetical protein
MVAEVVRISARQLLTTADHASLALQRAHRPHVGKTARRALSTVTHDQLVTHETHAMHARQPVATSDATGAQHLLLAAATFSAMTVHHAELAKTDLLALLTVTVAHLVALKTVRLAPSIAIHVRHVMTAHRALSIVTHAHRAIRVTVAHLVALKTDHNVIRTSLGQPVLSEAQPLLGTRVTHAHRATVTHARQELSTVQNHADHASSTTAHASSTATTATTAPTVVQTALTV